MGRSSAIALIPLVLVGLLSANACWAQGSSRARAYRWVQSLRWTLNYAQWTESVEMVRKDGRTYQIGSSSRAIALGYQIDWTQKWRGWFVEGQALIGDTHAESLDEALKYSSTSAPLSGLSLTGMRHWNFENPRLFLGVGVTSMWRQIQFQTPTSYSMDKSKQRLVHHLKLDFSFPLRPRFEVTQQFGIPLDGNGHYWQIGLRKN